MNIKKLTLGAADYPEELRNIPSPPKQLYCAGADLSELLKRPRVAIVGTRRMTAYGKMITLRLAQDLAEQGVVIISGLATGVDAVAHQAALDAGGLCIAVLPSPLDNVVPIFNRRLGQAILDQGGALVSEYAPGIPPQKQYFIARNRLVSGLADAVLITEAGEKSGAIHTANFALDQGRDVLVVPGNIHAAGSVGIHNLLKAGKAGAVTSYIDVINLLGLKDHSTPAPQVRGRNAYEQTVLDLMLQGISEGQILLEKSQLSASEFGRVLTMLEIGGKIRPLGANHWAIM
ncbi:DNA-protecting protein DprA [Candidatus Saccharibacteria bacterium CG_4_10_14_0_2_um_filter_52_9]|nr:MAG: DNA-protecting protein DprA [Candidatus Saccharibacteria bacterium CG_4_10_14_0_2_um_filter_52_9]